MPEALNDDIQEAIILTALTGQAPADHRRVSGKLSEKPPSQQEISQTAEKIVIICEL